MLGFSLSIHRQPKATARPGPYDEELKRYRYGEELMTWDGWPSDLLDSLIEQGRVRWLLQNGYPMLYVGERDALVEVATEAHLSSHRDCRELYLRAREPRDGAWLQSLSDRSNPVGVTRKVLVGKYSLPPRQGLICDTELDWIESLVAEGRVKCLEDGEEKLYRGPRETLVTEFLDHMLAPSRNDEALVLVAWDLS